MKFFLILYVANLILDYPLQGTFLAEFKAKNNYILFVHCAIWAFGISVVLMPLGLFAWWKDVDADVIKVEYINFVKDEED